MKLEFPILNENQYAVITVDVDTGIFVSSDGEYYNERAEHEADLSPAIRGV